MGGPGVGPEAYLKGYLGYLHAALLAEYDACFFQGSARWVARGSLLDDGRKCSDGAIP